MQRRRNHEASEDLKEGTAALDALQIIQIGMCFYIDCTHIEA
jgi:hypothetical protein